jgi:hypothetical protein
VTPWKCGAGVRLDDAFRSLNVACGVAQVARILASEITEKGARLYDLLGQEGKMQQARTKALRFLDSISGNLQSTSEHDYIEKCVPDLLHPFCCWTSAYPSE